MAIKIYDRKSSCGYANYAKVDGQPRTASKGEARDTWQQQIIKQVKENRNLDRIPSGEYCNLYITFYIKKTDAHNGNRLISDVDNLLKASLDALQDAGFIDNDRFIRGIKVEREVVEDDDDEGMEFLFLVTKSFFIRDARRLSSEEVQEKYSKSWQNDMYVIEASEVDSKTGIIEEDSYEFIDNAFGQVFWGENSEKTYPDAIPGYNWPAYKHKVVEGCLLFENAPSDGAEGERIWWIKKWPKLSY